MLYRAYKCDAVKTSDAFILTWAGLVDKAMTGPRCSCIRLRSLSLAKPRIWRSLCAGKAHAFAGIEAKISYYKDILCGKGPAGLITDQ